MTNQQRSRKKAVPDANATGNLRVLLVDDARIIVDRLTTALSQIPGVQVVASCYDSQSAISYILRERPDLLILDIQLRDSNGWEVLNYIESHRINLPVFVFSNDSSVALKVRFLTGGARKFFDKSFDFNQLRDAVQEFVTTPLN